MIFCSQRILTGVSPVDSGEAERTAIHPRKCSSPELCARLRRRHRVPRGPNDGSTAKNEQSQIADDLSPTPAVKHEPLLLRRNLTVRAPHWRRIHSNAPTHHARCSPARVWASGRWKQADRLLTRCPRLRQPVAVGKGVAQVETAYPFFSTCAASPANGLRRFMVGCAATPPTLQEPSSSENASSARRRIVSM